MAVGHQPAELVVVDLVGTERTPRPARHVLRAEIKWLERRLIEQPPAGVRTVLWHSHLWHQLD